MSTKDLSNEEFAKLFKKDRKARALLAKGHIECSKCGGSRRFITTLQQARLATSDGYVCVTCERREEAERAEARRKAIERKAIERKRAKKHGDWRDKTRARAARESTKHIPVPHFPLADQAGLMTWNLLQMKFLEVPEQAVGNNGVFTDKVRRRVGCRFTCSQDAIDLLDREIPKSEIAKSNGGMYWLEGPERPRPFVGFSSSRINSQLDVFGMERRGGPRHSATWKKAISYHPKSHLTWLVEEGAEGCAVAIRTATDSFVEFADKMTFSGYALCTASGAIIADDTNNDVPRELMRKRETMLAGGPSSGPLCARFTLRSMDGHRVEDFLFALY